jgi:hypothetical protein
LHTVVLPASGLAGPGGGAHLRGLFWRAYAPMPSEIPAPVRAGYRARGIEGMRENAEWVAVYRQPRSAATPTPTCSLARQRASPKIQFCPKFV